MISIICLIVIGLFIGRSKFGEKNIIPFAYKKPHVVKFSDGMYAIKTISVFIPLYLNLEKKDEILYRWIFAWEKDLIDCKTANKDKVFNCLKTLNQSTIEEVVEE